MRADPVLPLNEAYLSALFATRTAETGGVVKRNVLDIEREVGTARLAQEVRKRGFQLFRTRHHFLIVCNRAPVTRIV